MSEPRLAHRVMYDGLYTFILRALNIACAAGLGILTARVLGPGGKGLYSLPAVESALVAGAFSGLNSATAYFLLNRQCGAKCLWAALQMAVLFVVGGCVVLVPMALLSDQRWTLVPAMLSLPSAAIINIAMGYAIGTKRVPYSSALQVALTLVTFVMMLVAFFAVGRTATLAVAVWVIANLVVAGAAVAVLAIDSRRLQCAEGVRLREYGFFSLKIGMVNLISLLNYRADLYIIALMTSPAVLGMYTVGVSAAESLFVPTQVAALVTSPYIGGLDLRAAGHVTARCVRNNLLIALAICGTLGALAAPVIRVLYGSAFLPVVPALEILLVGVAAMALGSPMSSYFTLKLGRPDIPLRLASLSAAVCIALSIVLVPMQGMLGAAIGSTAGYLCGQLAALWVFRRKSSVPISRLLLPTVEDLAAYPAFAVKVLRDVHRFIRPSALGPTAHR